MKKIKKYQAETYDIAIIGAGHAGIEAALASARLGCKTAVFTINMDAVGNCPCNPAIGGTAKGQLVFEIDALGGEMGKAADYATIQSRMLNMSKGPAVQSLRAQIDRRKYSEYMKHALELQPNLYLKQAEVVELKKYKKGWNVVTKLGAVHSCKCVIIASGTYLSGIVYIGEVHYSSGPDGMFPANELSKSLQKLGIELRRFKTGTPARVLKSSIDFTNLVEQPGDSDPIPYSSETKQAIENKTICHISWTNEKTKEIILSNLDRSPLYSGVIEGVGPRYCPSIEDKVVHFPQKERHQCFIEPCGENTEEMYMQGISSSLPEEVQIQLYKTMDGLENLHIMRPAYAIEYDCVNPIELEPTLEFKAHRGLYGAGQFNGSSGYEEAAAQGLIAGINAARRVRGQQQLIFERSNSYIGTLIDDLVTKGVQDPYRMMTSRAEYRLVLRQDNADERLTPLAYDIGLIDEERYSRFLERKAQKYEEIERAKRTQIRPSDELNALLASLGTSPISETTRLSELLKRPELSYELLSEFDNERTQQDKRILSRAEVEIKYEGYIKRQNANIAEQKRLESKELPRDIDYSKITGLRLEAVEKLNKINPVSIGQASRISGVSPADIQVLIIWLAARKNAR